MCYGLVPANSVKAVMPFWWHFCSPGQKGGVSVQWDIPWGGGAPCCRAWLLEPESGAERTIVLFSWDETCNGGYPLCCFRLFSCIWSDSAFGIPYGVSTVRVRGVEQGAKCSFQLILGMILPALFTLTGPGLGVYLSEVSHPRCESFCSIFTLV